MAKPRKKKVDVDALFVVEHAGAPVEAVEEPPIVIETSGGSFRFKAPSEPNERDWYSYPADLSRRCSECSGLIRVTPSGPVCKRRHGGATRDADDLEASGGGVMDTVAGFPDEATLSKARDRIVKVAGRARVTFVEETTARLSQIDLEEFGAGVEEGAKDFGVSRSRVDGAFVKLTASIAPSERDSFDAQAFKARLLREGARAVLLAVRSVAEAPTKEAKESAASSLKPEDAIAAWFAGLPVPEEDRAAAKALALEILEAEGG